MVFQLFVFALLPVPLLVIALLVITFGKMNKRIKLLEEKVAHMENVGEDSTFN